MNSETVRKLSIQLQQKKLSLLINRSFKAIFTFWINILIVIKVEIFTLECFVRFYCVRPTLKRLFPYTDPDTSSRSPVYFRLVDFSHDKAIVLALAITTTINLLLFCW